MAKVYTVATVALALKVAPKWLDNLLSHHSVTGVDREAQGRSRRLSTPSVQLLAIALTLMNDLALSTPRSLALAAKLMSSGGRLQTPRGLRLEIDLNSARQVVIERLNYAVEVAPVPRRGRPPLNKTGRLT
ncbi:MAG TPA: hypothetical protein VNJ04_18985 [Gemmatimonadaceae bacterium]|nr:hypothetical protein [Gemmatimonadaceae bacterium]